MQKNSIYLIIALNLISSTSWAHSLRPALQELSRTAGEINGIGYPERADHYPKLLLNKIDQLWLKAIRIPGEKSIRKMHFLGFAVKRGDYRHDIVRTENYSYLNNDALSLKPERWIDLENPIQEHLTWLKELRTLLDDSSVTKHISPEASSQAMVDTHKDSLLQDLMAIRNETLQCIAEAKPLHDSIGVKIIEAGDKFQWDSNDLQSKYGVNSADSFSFDDKTAFVSKIEKAVRTPSFTSGICVANAKLTFLYSELVRLKEALR